MKPIFVLKWVPKWWLSRWPPSWMTSWILSRHSPRSKTYLVKFVALYVLIFWFFSPWNFIDTKLIKVPKRISTDIETSFDTNNNSSESQLVRIIITHKVFKDAGKYWSFFWALTFMISWCLKNSEVIVCVQLASLYSRSIFFLFCHSSRKGHRSIVAPECK